MLRSAEEIDESTKKRIASKLLYGKKWTRSTRKGNQIVETVDWRNDVQGMDWERNDKGREKGSELRMSEGEKISVEGKCWVKTVIRPGNLWTVEKL